MDDGRVYPGSELAASDFAEFLSQAYMGGDRQFGLELQWGRCLRCAYLDFNRTLRGFGDCPDKTARLRESAKWLEDRIAILASTDHPATQASFDKWHLETRHELQRLMGVWKGGGSMCPGQSQKWVNMSLKYIFTLKSLGVTRSFSPEQSVYQLAHLPLDKYV